MGPWKEQGKRSGEEPCAQLGSPPPSVPQCPACGSFPDPGLGLFTKITLTGESKAVGDQCDFQPLLRLPWFHRQDCWGLVSPFLTHTQRPSQPSGDLSGFRSCEPGARCGDQLGASTSISASHPHFVDGDSEARGGQCSPSRAPAPPHPGVLLSSGFLPGVLLAPIYCAIFQLGEGGDLGWTVCPGQGASLQPLGTAQPYFLRADCALTRTSCPLHIWSE